MRSFRAVSQGTEAKQVKGLKEPEIKHHPCSSESARPHRTHLTSSDASRKPGQSQRGPAALGAALVSASLGDAAALARLLSGGLGRGRSVTLEVALDGLLEQARFDHGAQPVRAVALCDQRAVVDLRIDLAPPAEGQTLVERAGLRVPGSHYGVRDPTQDAPKVAVAPARPTACPVSESEDGYGHESGLPRPA